MNIVKVFKSPSYWLYPGDLGDIISRKQPTKILRAFREFCDNNPHYFYPCKPYRDEGKTQYNIYCFLHYFENEGLLEAGTRSLSFEEDLPRLMRAYSLHLMPAEEV
ncbi:hypothetical protein [Hutsoniella sourekii]|uniref:hypothetical protein n=1 Tax=Hutsoniella sourekii TaxID=87650 RepID=UPI000480C8C2|nr:hypothetical protein [Hutsoniella sourekii]